MTTPTLVLVSGRAASGKTSLSRALASRLSLPLLSKDTIKEILFDGLGPGDRIWSEKLNVPIFNILLYVLEQHFVAGASVILETPYDDGFPRQAFSDLQDRFGCRVIQLMCFARTDILIQRFENRIGAPERHPGHNDADALEEYKESIRETSKMQPLDLRGQVFEIDTSDFTAVDMDAITAAVRAVISTKSSGSPVKLSPRYLKLLARLRRS